jgi:hypothetical protein
MRDRMARREPVLEDSYGYHDQDDHAVSINEETSPLRHYLSPARSLPMTILILVTIAFVTNALYFQQGNRATLIPNLLMSMRSVFIGATPVDPNAVPAPPRRPDPALGDVSVALAERALIRVGYFSGPAEGLKSATYREALMRFQKDRHLPLTGELDEPTKRELEKLSGLPVE